MALVVSGKAPDSPELPHRFPKVKRAPIVIARHPCVSKTGRSLLLVR